jgi:hypothetical protein
MTATGQVIALTSNVVPAAAVGESVVGVACNAVCKYFLDAAQPPRQVRGIREHRLVGLGERKAACMDRDLAPVVAHLLRDDAHGLVTIPGVPYGQRAGYQRLAAGPPHVGDRTTGHRGNHAVGRRRKRESVGAAGRSSNGDEAVDHEVIENSEGIGDPAANRAARLRRRPPIAGSIDPDEPESRRSRSRTCRRASESRTPSPAWGSRGFRTPGSGWTTTPAPISI